MLASPLVPVLHPISRNSNAAILTQFTVSFLRVGYQSTLAQELTITIEVNPQAPTQVVIPSFNPPPPINIPPVVSAPPPVSAESAGPTSSEPATGAASIATVTTDSFGEGCFTPDSLSNEVGRSLQRVDVLGQATATSGSSQDLIALTSEFNRLEGLLNALIDVYGEEIVSSGTPGCDNLASSIQEFIEEIQAYLDILQQQLFTLLW